MTHPNIPPTQEQQKAQEAYDKFLKERSRLLSRILRHKPQSVGIELDEQGWVAVDVLLKALQNSKFTMDRAVLDEVVAKNDKQRFSYSADGTKIRANQGHSVKVSLGLVPQTPPDVLYHGTAQASLESIYKTGLSPQKRHHVHLSPDIPTAIKVGKRHGKVAVLAVDAKAMSDLGYVFYVSDNGVWLTDAVPAQYLTRLMDLGNGLSFLGQV